ncbi:MAG: hypothetical protein K0V04_25815 [Deltaproteobacteria bacterium]|nr:hypothetical protein [Deltaproteobacteria bacterium]
MTLIPRVEFGTIALVNVPATIQPLATGDPAEGGGAPTVVLGRQALQAFGTITFDFPRAVVELAREAPTGPTGSEVESLLVMLGMFTRYAPIVPISIDGSDHVFFAYLGSTYVSALTMTRKHYLLSGHLPRQLDPPDDAEAGLKMVYIDGLSIGTTIVPGLSGLVLVNEPADPALDVVLQSTQFEVGGHINVNLMRTWRISYAMGSGAVYIDVGQ